MREDEKRIMAFLDESQVKYGANSSAYIRSVISSFFGLWGLTRIPSFGTSFWPTLRPELITHHHHFPSRARTARPIHLRNGQSHR